MYIVSMSICFYYIYIIYIDPDASIILLLLRKLLNSKMSKDLNEFLIILEVGIVIMDVVTYVCINEAPCMYNSYMQGIKHLHWNGITNALF